MLKAIGSVACVTFGSAMGLAAVPAVAQSDFLSDTGTLQLYARLNAGVALPGTIRVDGAAGSNGSPPFSGTMSFNAGPSFSLAIGGQLTDNFRGEIGVAMARNTASSYSFDFTGFGNVSGKATGTITTTGIMAVGYYDFTDLGAITPYLSAGLGLANVSTSDLVADVSLTGTTSGSSTVPAARIGAGFTYNLNDQVSFGTDYFLVIGGRATLSYSDPANANTRTITADVMGHSLTGSLKIKF